MNILIDDMIKKDYNILYFDKKYKFYPYIFGDIGIGYILFLNNIEFKNYKNMWYNPHYQNFDNNESCHHQ